METIDKQWARKYILDPLTAPEPSQETGPGSSHFNHHRASYTPRQHQPPQQPRLHHRSQSHMQLRTSSCYIPRRQPNLEPDGSSQGYHYSCGYEYKSRHRPDDSKGFSVSTATLTPPPAPLHKSRSVSDSLTSSHGSSSPATTTTMTSSSFHPSNPYSSSQRQLNSRLSPSEEVLIPPAPPRALPEESKSRVPPGVSRSRHVSLGGRFQGDMTHRPLDMLEQENRAVNSARAPRSHHRRRISDVDTIDSLDTIGGTYHHGGPFDAALLSRNLIWDSSPLAAVHDSNMEAIRATPRENIADSLQRHIPLQGTATVRSGDVDATGAKMDYVEGPDLMREPDAPGGPYRRWAHVKYHPDDLKGKGEPSYTFERDLKDAKASACKRKKAGQVEHGIEMETGPRFSGCRRQRSSSETAASSSHGTGFAKPELQRQASTGKRISDGLKRRFGSLRKKASPK